MKKIQVGHRFILKSIFILGIIALAACNTAIEDKSNRFREGVFEIPAGDDFVKENIIRKDSIQISKYGNFVDTLSIEWKNNFFYTLRYINPKNDLQKDPMYIQITEVRDDSYDFTVKIGFSKFEKSGTVYKIE